MKKLPNNLHYNGKTIETKDGRPLDEYLQERFGTDPIDIVIVNREWADYMYTMTTYGRAS